MSDGLHIWRTARKGRACTGRDAGDCARWIAPGDRYCATSLPPHGEMGNETWWHGYLCTPCATYYRDVPNDPKTTPEEG